ncbi:MAG: hypothetical protein ACP5TL_00650 [Candidatus Micrarchaeia archaeon]
MIPIEMFLFLSSSFTTAKSLLMPLVVVALMLDSAFIAIWYLIGTALGNSTVKAGARDEFYQLIGTVLLIAIVLGILYVIASSYISILNSTALMNSNTMYTLCQNVESLPKSLSLNIVHDFLAGNSKFEGLCNIVKAGSLSPQNQPTVTEELDYPLAASSVIVASLTDQSVREYNAAFLFDAFVGYLSKLSPQINVCVYPGWLSPCIIPLYGAMQSPDFLLHVAFTPYSGYSFIYKLLTPLGTLMTTAIEFFVAQLSINVIALYIWPYLIFLGLLFRSVFFTRKLGGLLIATAIGVILFYPTIYSIEYISLSKSTSYYNSTYGYNTVTNIPNSASSSINTYYTLNFFSLPDLTAAISHYGCMPLGGNLISADTADSIVLLIPFYSIAAGVISAIESGSVVPNFYLPSTCSPSNIMPVTFMLFEAYSIMGVTAYFLPIINLLITLTAIIGLSGLLGGDTELAGLAKLI